MYYEVGLAQFAETDIIEDCQSKQRPIQTMALSNKLLLLSSLKGSPDSSSSESFHSVHCSLAEYFLWTLFDFE